VLQFGSLQQHLIPAMATRECGGAEKFWAKEHHDRVVSSHALQTYPMFWFGPCRDWSVDPRQYLPGPSHHLLQDVIDFLPQILQLDPGVRSATTMAGIRYVRPSTNDSPTPASLAQAVCGGLGFESRTAAHRKTQDQSRITGDFTQGKKLPG
jgi:hypothetical protein